MRSRKGESAELPLNLFLLLWACYSLFEQCFWLCVYDLSLEHCRILVQAVGLDLRSLSRYGCSCV